MWVQNSNRPGDIVGGSDGRPVYGRADWTDQADESADRTQLRWRPLAVMNVSRSRSVAMVVCGMAVGAMLGTGCASSDQATSSTSQSVATTAGSTVPLTTSSQASAVTSTTATLIEPTTEVIPGSTSPASVVPADTAITIGPDDVRLSGLPTGVPLAVPDGVYAETVTDADLARLGVDPSLMAENHGVYTDSEPCSPNPSPRPYS